MDACAFCAIIAGKATAIILHRDKRAVAFRDAHPVAPTHILIVPVRHVSSLNDLQTGDQEMLGHLLLVAQRLAATEGLQRGGFRLVLNTGPDAGQSVFHLHLHLLGGRQMHWPPG